jgi:hypothetical protein
LSKGLREVIMKVCKLLLAAVGAIVLLGALVSSAGARNFSVSNQSMRVSYREVTFTGGATDTRCQVTLEGSLHRTTMPKVSGSLIGYITSAILGPCETGTSTILRETLPWHIRYHGFAGTLPNITLIRTHIIGFAWRFREVFGTNCLIRSTAAEPVMATFHRRIETHRLEEVTLNGSIRTGPECLEVFKTIGSDLAKVSLLGASHTAIFVSLI